MGEKKLALAKKRYFGIMTEILKFDKFGRVTFPKSIRQIMNASPGSKVRAEVDTTSGVVILKRLVHDQPYLTYTDWGWPQINYPDNQSHDYDIVKEIEEARNARADHVAGIKRYDD